MFPDAKSCFHAKKGTQLQASGANDYYPALGVTVSKDLSLYTSVHSILSLCQGFYDIR